MIKIGKKFAVFGTTRQGERVLLGEADTREEAIDMADALQIGEIVSAGGVDMRRRQDGR